MVNYDALRNILEQTRRQEAENLDISELVSRVRYICKEINYSEISSYIKEQTKDGSCKYSIGTYLMGYQGYYYPSEIEVLMTANMKRGRLVKKSDRSDYIYEYDGNGNIRHIVMPDCHATTYCLEQGDVQFRITYADFNNKENPEVLATTIELKNPKGRTLCLIGLFWSYKMESADEVNIEIHDIEQSICCWIHSGSDLKGGYEMYYIYNILYQYDKKIKIVDYRRVYSII